MKKLQKIGILLLALILITSCSPEHKLKRANRKLAKLIELNPQLVKSDTIYKKDTTIVYGVTRDTVFKNTITKDTIVIREKHLEIKYYNDGKNVYIKGKCDTVYIIKELPIAVNTVRPVKYTNKLNWWQKTLIVIGGSAIVFIVLDQIAARRR